MSSSALSSVVDALVREGRSWQRVREEIRALPKRESVDLVELRASSRALDRAVELYVDAVVVRARIGGANEGEIDDEVDAAYARLDRALEREERKLQARAVGERLESLLLDARALLEELSALGVEELSLDDANDAVSDLEAILRDGSLSRLERQLEL